ncbi:MAG: DUF3419 family protein [Chlamydiales bacterium]
MGNFYSRLSYSIGNEDWKTEQKALKIQPNDRVVCITGSGDRPLNLLKADLQEVITIDANPMQNALFDLKKAALSCLPKKEYRDFLGVNPSVKTNRLETYKQLSPHLDPSTVALWKRHLSKIRRGILYEGAMEKSLKRISKVLRFFRKKKIDVLFNFDDLEKQCAFLDEEWHSYYWRKTFDVFLQPFISRLCVGDPGLYEHIDSNLNISSYLFSRFHASLYRFLAKENLIVSLVLKGSIDKNYLPPYLSEKDMDTISSRLDRSRFKTIGLVEFLERSPPNHFDCFSMSDVASYMDRDNFHRTMKAIFRTAKPQARFCIRQFLSNHQIPPSLASHFKRNHELEKELEQEDRCFVYHFMVGTIEK